MNLRKERTVNMRTRNSLIVLASLLVTPACSDGTNDAKHDVGKLQVALGGDGPQHDVAQVEVTILDATDPNGCDGTPLASSTVALEEEALPANLDPDGADGDGHPFADALFVLPPGDYLACATPLDAAGVRSSHCARAQGPTAVMAEMTTEITLVSMCQGAPNGGLDVIAALNDPPIIEDLTIEPSKFITVCQTATITLSTTDLDGDETSIEWGPAEGPAEAEITVPYPNVAVFHPPDPGDYAIPVTVTDSHGATASLSFPIHVTDVEICPGTVLWTSRFGDSSTVEEGNGVATDAAGNIFVTGATAPMGGLPDLLLVKFDPDGAVLWSATYDGGDRDRGFRVAVHPSGDVCVTGTTTDPDTGSEDVLVACFAPDGTFRWAQNHDGGGARDFGAAIGFNPDDELVVVGGVATASLPDTWLARYDLDGNLLSSQLFARPGGNGDGFSAEVDGSGGAAVVGAMWASGTPRTFIQRYDAAGNQLWERTYADGPFYSAGMGLDDAGNIVVQAPYGSGQRRVGKYGPTGDELWNVVYDEALGSGGSGNGDFVMDDLGNIYGTFSLWRENVILDKHSQTGDRLLFSAWWYYRVVARAITLDPAGDVVIAGQIADGTNGDVHVMKMAP